MRRSKSNHGKNRGLKQIAGAAEGQPEAIDRLIHERVRLSLISSLAAGGAMSFHDLKDSLGITDGNLSVHARKLEEAGYISCEKYFRGRVPRTEYRITDSGRSALCSYLDHMEAIIRAVQRQPSGRAGDGKKTHK